MSSFPHEPWPEHPFGHAALATAASARATINFIFAERNKKNQKRIKNHGHIKNKGEL
jgi:hypothetical protein